MQKAHILFVVILGILFAQCDTFDPDGNGKPTSLHGKVIFGDTNEPVTGKIWMTGIKEDFPGDQQIVNEIDDINVDGSFNFSFDGDKNIDFFVITLVAEDEDPLENSIKGYECLSFNCERISPGLDYDNFLIKAERN